MQGGSAIIGKGLSVRGCSAEVMSYDRYLGVSPYPSPSPPSNRTKEGPQVGVTGIATNT